MNDNILNIQISGIRKFAEKVKNVEGAISLTIGQPDFNVPCSVKSAMIDAINENKTSYTSNAGIEELREEISKYLKTIGIKYDKDEIILTIGGSEGLYAAFSALLSKKDKILIPTPAYPAYENISKILGADVINYDLNSDFSVNINNIKEKIKFNKDIKYLMLSFPSNPTGALMTYENMKELIEIIKENNLYVIDDGMYASIIFDKYYSVAQDEDLKNQVIYISGFSKMFSMTGLRIGYVACGKKILKEISKVHQYGVSCAPSISQYGALEGLKNCRSDVENMRKIFENRKNYCMKRLKELGFDVNEPKGAFYIFPSIKKFNMTSEKFCEKLLTEGKVGCVPGSAFGKGGEGYMRISYCYSDDTLKEAFDRIEIFLAKLK
ncbi:aminotransferase class I/II-fold pyridoxal phosphate-dependent enzyme [Clostridium sp. BJN0001]|uniref:pyridoxal phosphate-dependent aminotransferase n=1 Tax=Clostridium sp. BJN0001 TaxID=2930219 RepID=UPI001FCFDB58|nr:aminotransferase class I/II-fold pyridoxal phosphate-dependent enzyme [Clostridium sp. BJN0001]